MLTIKTTLKEVPGMGIGLFADEDLTKEQIWWEWDPSIDLMIQSEEFKSLSKLAQAFVEKYTVKDKFGNYWLDSDNGKFVNHSNLPNSTGIDYIDGISMKVKTIKPVLKGEELTMNYREFTHDYPDGKLTFEIK
jgi:SET domain-containing protein